MVSFFSGVARYGSPQETPAPPPACQRPDRPDGGQHLLHNPAASPFHNGPQCHGAQGLLHRGMQYAEVTDIIQIYFFLIVLLILSHISYFVLVFMAVESNIVKQKQTFFHIKCI